MAGFLEVTLGGLLGSGIASVMAAAIFLRRNKKVESEISSIYQRQSKVFDSTRAWKEQSLSSLLGPMIMQLDRTKRAFDRWNAKNLYLEAKIIGEGNLKVRDLLLAHGHLIPPDLFEDAGLLVQHYDRWLEEFERARADKPQGDDEAFVFAGPVGYPFPSASEQRFQKRFQELQKELYGPSTAGT